MTDVVLGLRRVVVGIDFLAAGDAAARWAARHLAPGAELVLVHSVVIPEPPSVLRGRFPPREVLLETARRGAALRLSELSRELGASAVRLEIREGNPAEQLAAVAAELGADLVVVGAHGKRPGLWDRLGSTAEAVARTSRVPVLLAAGALSGPPRRLLVPARDGRVLDRVAAWTRLLGERFDAKIVVLHVEAEAPGRVPSLSDVVARADENDAAPAHWRPVACCFDAARVFADAACGDPAQVIRSEAERFDSDLIVLSTGAPHAVRRAVLGDPVGTLLRGAPCCVLVVADRLDPAAHGATADAEDAAPRTPSWHMPELPPVFG